MTVHLNIPLVRQVLPSFFIFFSAALAATTAQPASALTWDWSFQRNATPSVNSFGQLNTSDIPDSQGFFTITEVTGERNSVPITSFIPTGSPIPGNCGKNCFNSDNLLSSSDPQLTTHGFGVGFADGTFANYFFASFLKPQTYLEYFSAPPFAPLPPGKEDSELAGLFRASPVAPVPGPLPIAGAWLSWSFARQLRRRQRAGR